MMQWAPAARPSFAAVSAPHLPRTHVIATLAFALRTVFQDELLSPSRRIVIVGVLGTLRASTTSIIRGRP